MVNETLKAAGGTVVERVERLAHEIVFPIAVYWQFSARQRHWPRRAHASGAMRGSGIVAVGPIARSRPGIGVRSLG